MTNPRHEIWNALSESFGEPRTRTEQTAFGKVTAELLEAGATPEETATACAYVLGNFDSPSVFAVTKWFSASLTASPKLSVQQQAIQQLRSVK